jgi:iron complex outermembrane recepter protein
MKKKTQSNFLSGSYLAFMCLGSIVVATPMALAQDPTNAESTRNARLEEIVVTASKREEKLTDVAASIAAFSSSTIERMGIVDVDDYTSLTPSLTYADSGQPGSGAVVIRGTSTGDSAWSNTVGFYLDESIFTLSGTWSGGGFMTPNADLADIERIEILKGPQATLYGANSIGGIIRIITKKPDPNEFYGRVASELSSVQNGSEGYNVRGSFNIPLVKDKLAVAINGFHREDPGYFDNVATGDKNANKTTITGGRIALRYFATDDLIIDVNGFVQDIDNDHAAIEDSFAGTLTPMNGKYQFSQPAGDLPNTSDYKAIGSTITYSTDYGDLVANISYGEYELIRRQDRTVQFAGLAALTGAQPGATSLLTFETGGSKFTTEARFSSNRLGKFEFITGVFYTDEDVFFQTDTPVVNPDGTTPPLFEGNVLFSPNPGTYKEISGYGNITFYLTENIDITGGVRYSENNQFVDSTTRGVLGLFFPTSTYKFKDSNIDYLGTIRWRPNDDLNLYARLASGYRPGGPNIGAVNFGPFEADIVENYELGAKGFLFNKLASYSIAGYISDWKDVQLTGRDPISQSSVTVNGASATLKGIEIEAGIYPIEGLSLSAGITHTKTKLKKITDPSVGIANGAVEGDPLPESPKWSAFALVDYVFPVLGNIDGNVGATLKYRDKIFTNFPGNPETTVIPSYETVDLRAGLKFQNGLSLTFRIKNLTNSSAPINNIVLGKGFTVRTQPRTFLLGAGFDF